LILFGLTILLVTLLGNGYELEAYHYALPSKCSQHQFNCSPAWFHDTP
jgi:hypothetical protein